MALIDDIIAKLNAIPIVVDGSMTLTPADFDIDFVSAFFTQVIGGDSFKITQAVKTPGAGTMTLTGRADLMGYTDLSINFSFAPQQGLEAEPGAVVITLDGSFAKDKAVQLPVLTWIQVSNIGLTTSFSGPYNIVTFMFHANIGVKGDTTGGIPIKIGAVNNGTWQIDIAEGANHPVTVEQLIALLSGNALNGFLPQALVDKLEGLQVNDINTSFNTANKTISYFSTGVTVTNGWDIVTNVSLAPGLQLALTLINPTDPATREAIGIVTGTFLINTVAVPVFVQADVTSDSTNWSLGLDPKSAGVTLPSFSDLFVFAAGQSFADSLPSGLKDIPQINVSKLRVDFSLKPANLELVTFAAHTTSPWPVIDGFLNIEELYFELDLLNLTAETKRQVGGRVGSTLAITDSVWIYFVIEKDAASTDWTLQGGLPPEKSLNLTDLIRKLLSSYVTLPANAPVISLDTVTTTVTPGKSMTFTAGSKSTWTLVSGQLEINSFTFNFNYNALATTEKFSGSLETDLTIAKAPIHISAAMNNAGNAGWQFDGSTAPGQPLEVGDLISDIGTKFGVSVPKPIQSFTLQDIRLHFVGGTDQGGPKEFGFGCTGKFSIAGNEIDATVAIAVTRKTAGAGYDKVANGTLLINTASGGTETFHVTFSSNDQDEFINVNWSASAGHELTIEDVAKTFGFSDMPDLPRSLKGLGLSSVTFTYDFTKQVLVAGLVITKAGSPGNFGEAILISDTLSAGKQVYIVGLNIQLGIKLADIPLVGDKLPDAQNLGIKDAGIWVVSQPLLKSDVEKINPLIDATKYRILPDSDITAKVLLSADLQLGAGAATPFQLSVGSDQSQQSSQPTATTQASSTRGETTAIEQGTAMAPATTDNTKWLNVEKQFGVFQFKRIGISYHDDSLLFALDAAIMFGPLTFSMDGLSISSALTHFDPKFDLSGLGVAYVKPPLEIMGALLKVPGSQLAPGVKFQFDGVLVMKSLSYSLSAIGSYAQTTSGPSFFVFAQLEAALGGPPAFFVTGLMAGFGFNRLLTIPGQNEVMDFPLLVLAQPPAPGSPTAPQDPMHVLDVLEGRAPITKGGSTKQWIAPSTGDYWLAVGIEFTCFELVSSKALLIVEFGNDFQVVLLGLSTMRLPQVGDQSYAYVEMQLKAVFRPQDGFFGLTAILSSNSFVIDPACHLTGGFAFYLWFGSNPNAGQFVITLGGYHPAFKPPDYYPQVPRLGFNWAVSDVVSVKGDAYFALTPSCVMAGGGLEILFHDGDLRAWFTAHADLLISWHPFFFIAHIDVDIGVSYRLNLLFCHKTISISIGATVDMWGPPTGGTVHVHLYVVSFTVHFGSDSAGQQNQPLQWPEFKTLLPAPNDVCKITVSNGLYKSMDSTVSSSGQAWVVRATNFRCFTQSTIPASHLTYGPAQSKGLMTAVGDSGINIKPMNLTGVTSIHSISIYRNSVTTPPVDVSEWTLQPRFQNVPEALWGQPPQPPAQFTQIPDQPTADVIPNQGVGYDLQAPQPVVGPSQGLIQLSELAEDYVLPPSSVPISTAVAPSQDYLPSFNQTTVAQIEQIMGDKALQNREAIYGMLESAGLYRGSHGTLTNMESKAGHIFADSPMQQS
jgi:hypothetical protein